MKCSIITLVALAAATPLDTNTFAGQSLRRATYCGTSTFLDRPMENVSISDCEQMVIPSNTWTVIASAENHQLVEYSSCAFGVSAEDPHVTFAYIGDEDVITAIKGAIKRFSHDGKVGAEGVFACKSDGAGDLDVHWTLYRNGG